MRIQVRDFSFEPPFGLEDWTNYSFKSPDNREQLTISRGTRPAEAHDLVSLLKGRKEDLELLLSGQTKLENEGDALIGEWPARTLSFTIKEGKEQFREHWAVAFDSSSTYVQISYGTPASDSRAADRFAEIIRRAGLEERPASKPPASSVRRWAGLWIDVRAFLEPPRTYAFGTVDEKTRITLTYYGPSPAPDLEQEMMEQDGRLGAISEKRTAPLTAGQANGSMLSYTLTAETADGTETDACIRVMLSYSSGPRVHIYARAPIAEASALDRILSSWIGTFRAGS